MEHCSFSQRIDHEQSGSCREVQSLFRQRKRSSGVLRSPGGLPIIFGEEYVFQHILEPFVEVLAFNPADRPSLLEMKRVIDSALVILNAEEEKLRNPYFDSIGRNLRYHRGLPEHESPVKPYLPRRFSIRGSLQLDYPHRTPDPRARVDFVGFAQAGSAIETIGGNTNIYSVQPIKYDLILETLK